MIGQQRSSNRIYIPEFRNVKLQTDLKMDVLLPGTPMSAEDELEVNHFLVNELSIMIGVKYKSL